MIDLTDDMIVKYGKRELLRYNILRIVLLVFAIIILDIGIYASITSNSIIPVIAFGVITALVIGTMNIIFKKVGKDIIKWLKSGNWYVYETSILDKKIDKEYIDDKGHRFYELVLQKDGVVAQVSSSLYDSVNKGDLIYVISENTGEVINIYPKEKYNYIGDRLKIN